MDNLNSDLKGTAKKIQETLNLPEDFLEKLLDEDDWSFIIKLHALMEAAVAYLLTQHFDDERLSGIFEYLELSDARKGKIAFVKELNLLPSECRRFLRTLSEIRNSLVHNVVNVNFNLENHVKNLNKEQFKNFSTAIESVDYNQLDFGQNNEHKQNWIAFSSKKLIYNFGLMILVFIYLNQEINFNKKELSKTKEKLLKFYESLPL